MLDVDSPLPNTEIKMFSSHQGGGTGILIGNSSRGNSIIFLPHVGGNYVFTNSGVVPQRNVYYHVVGVWDKQAGKTSVYINGELKGQVSVSGDFTFPSSGSNWFCIGADPSGSSANTAWKGDVVMSRIFDNALSAAEVAKLWEKVDELKSDPNGIQITGVMLLSRNVQIGSQYVIEGLGFEAGDKIKMTPLSGAGTEFMCDCTIGVGTLSVTIPDDFTTGTYRLLVIRGTKTFDLGFTTLTLTDNNKLPRVIAHRGYWTQGAPENSIASLAKAQELNIFGSELDVWITTDGQVVLNHDNTINNIRIENATYDQIKDIRLSNGDPISTLDDCLEQARKNTSFKLIIELKVHSYSQNGVSNNLRVAQAVYDMVKAANLSDQVEYISFSLDICKRLVELDPNAIVGYLNGTQSPNALYNMGIMCMDYSMASIRNQIDWIAEAQRLGMFVNVWTVNNESDIQEMINLGVDYITTDYPELVLELIEKNR